MSTINELRALVERCTKKDGPPPYRELYQLSSDTPSLSINSMPQWHALPCVTREHLGNFSLQERCFVPWTQVERISVTSGTSGRPPFFSAAGASHGSDFLSTWDDCSAPILCAHRHYYRLMQHLNSIGSKVPVYIIDPRAIAQSIAVAKAAGVESVIMLMPYLRQLGDEMQRQGLAQTIRFVSVGGELPSSHMHYIKSIFPHATIIARYSASEVESNPIGVPCRALSLEHPNPVYHANRDIHLDLLDADTGEDIEPHVGVEGDLIVTLTDEHAASPLIRYRIGDRVRVVEASCAQHGTWSFTVLGRSATDFAKIQGGQLRVDELERVMHLYEAELTGEFEMHYKEEAGPLGPRLIATLYVESRGALDYLGLAESIAEELRVGPSFAYARGVERGWYAPLLCEPLLSLPQGKRKRLQRM